MTYQHKIHMHNYSIDDYVNAYDAICRAHNLESLEMYDDVMIAVFKHRLVDARPSHEWNFMFRSSQSNVSLMFNNHVCCLSTSTMNSWNEIRHMHYLNVHDAKVKKFIIDVILENAQTADVIVMKSNLVERSNRRIVIAKHNDTLESLLVKADLELNA